MSAVFSSTTHEDQNLEMYSLIWLDTSVDVSQENIQAQKQLRTSINHLLTFEDEPQCFQYIKSLSKDDRVILIVSGRLGQIIVPKIVEYRHIVSIYVYCMNKQANENWAKNFNKVKAVIVELKEIIHRIETDQHERKNNKIDEPLSIAIINSNDNAYGQSTIDLSGQFLHSQILIDCLIKMKSDANDIKEFISLCKERYHGNSFQFSIVDEFEREYSSDRALWWYTRNSFLYQMLNKALRVQNIHLLFLLRFFIRDIEQQLEKYKCVRPIRVYRAQLMSKEEIQILKNSLGEFFAINSFFSTSFDRERARAFFPSDIRFTDVERVFFEVDADPQLDNIKPFGDISAHSYYPNEKEVLFMIGSIFQLSNIDRDSDGILIVRMKLYSLNDHHVHSLFQHMQKKGIHGETNVLSFCSVLHDMGKWDDAEKYYHRLLNELPDNHKSIAYCYQGLGSIARNKGDYESSLKWYNRSLEMKTRLLKPNDPSIAKTCTSIGNAYEEKKDYAHALESHEKALKIYRQVYGEDHVDVAMCLNNIGICYKEQHRYPEALELHKKALSIREKHLPADHTALGRTHKNMGTVYRKLQHYDIAVSHYNLTLKIYKKSRPSQHPSIGSTLANIGRIHEEKGDFQQGLSYFEQAAVIYNHSLSPTHHDVIQNKKDIQRISSKIK